jgi:CDP-diacylglycerol---serine O-phosphatidyltransferase
MISNLATMGWTSMRPRRAIRLEFIALSGLVLAALLTEPWLTLVGLCAVYLAMLPAGIMRYRRVKLQRAAARRSLREPA